jgi:multidrug resistance protein MdtO
MAQPAVDGRALWRQLVEAAPGRFAFAARLALACAITAVVTAFYQTPSPALTAYVAFFVNKPDRTETVVLCVAMTLLITVILGFTTLVADLVLDWSGWRLAAMTAISLGLLFLVSASKLRPLGGIIAIAAYALGHLLGWCGPTISRRARPTLAVRRHPGRRLVGAGLLLRASPRRLVERELARWRHGHVGVARAGRARAGARGAPRSGLAQSRAEARRARARRRRGLAALRQAVDARCASRPRVWRSPLAMLPEPVRAALAAAIEPGCRARTRDRPPEPCARSGGHGGSTRRGRDRAVNASWRSFRARLWRPALRAPRPRGAGAGTFDSPEGVLGHFLPCLQHPDRSLRREDDGRGDVLLPAIRSSTGRASTPA